MSRGVVLWPDPQTSAVIRSIWSDLAAAGLPSLATYTHRLHQPHCSLVVGEALATDGVLVAVGRVPARPIRLRVDSIGVFPGSAALFLAVTTNTALRAEQRRVHDLAAPYVTDEWPWFDPEGWMAHITLGMAYTPDQLAAALPLVLSYLPINGTFDQGGVEDGSTGEHWAAS